MDYELDSVLVACPTYDGLSDCLGEYLAAYHAFRWHKKDCLLVDNTRDGGKYFASLNSIGVRVKRVEPRASFQETFSLCWQEILAHAKEKRVHWVLSIEQDVICPPLTIDALLNIASYVQAPFVTHTYPYHFGVKKEYQGLGCTLIHVNILEQAMEYDKDNKVVEGSIYEMGKRVSHVSLTKLLELKHLDGTRRHWQYADEVDPRVHYPPEYAKAAGAPDPRVEPKIATCGDPSWLPANARMQ